MKLLEIGKVYTLRNGLKTKPLRKSKGGNYKFEANVKELQHETESVMYWKPNGKSLLDYIDHEHDIIDNI